MRYRFVVLMFVLQGLLIAQTPSAREIVKKVDENALSDTKVVVSKMVIHGRRGKRTIKARSWQRNIIDSFTEYLAPAREKGTKMLKLENQLWIYSPATDRTILISGHMLRQSVMGSDLSYEDMMEDPYLQNTYNAEITGTDTVLNRPVWILDLQAKSKDLSYDKRRIWVDKERFIILKGNLYAKSGKLLKQFNVETVARVEGRWVATSMNFKDMLKEGEGTRMMVEAIRFSEKIPHHIFSKASLRR